MTVKKILLVSGSLSEHVIGDMKERYGYEAGFAIQKYYRLLEKGFERNGMEIDAVSILPIPKKNAPFKLKRYTREKERNVCYSYVPFLAFPPLYHVWMLFCVMWRVFWWSIKNRKDGVVVCDILIPCLCIGTALGSALAHGRRVAWITDMPGMDNQRCLHYDEMSVLGRWQMQCIYRFSGYIFTTVQTYDMLNPHKRPYIVMEGLVDPDVKAPEGLEKNTTRDIFYAGGLVDAYGLDTLCQAFMKLKNEDIRLVIYGRGPLAEKIKEYAKEDSRIDYRGAASNNIIVEAEQKATLLVNPRFTGGEYTLYSYPSKNIEYMVSGTPCVTTRLAGIPSDHYPYIYTFDEETVDGYANTLQSLLKHTNEELLAFGTMAQQYILGNKNATVQTKRIINLVNDIINGVVTTNYPPPVD